MGFDRERFVKFIKAKFIEWRGNTDGKWSHYAEYIGVSQQTMASWKNGYLKRQPDLVSCAKLIDKYGKEAYDALGLPESPSGLSQEELSSLGSVFKEIRGIDPETDDGLRRILDILTKHNLTVRSIK